MVTVFLDYVLHLDALQNHSLIKQYANCMDLVMFKLYLLGLGMYKVS